MNAVVVHVSDDADDFAPRIRGTVADSFPDRRLRALPYLTCHVLGYHRDRSTLEYLGPCEIATRDESCAHCQKEIRRDEFVAAHGRNLSLYVPVILRENGIAA